VPGATENGARKRGLHAQVFRGTRVAVRTLLDYLTAGDTLDTFLTNVPRVSREQAVAVLHRAMHSLGVLALYWLSMPA
jgi:Protein of unknown function (DUF433)